MIINNSKLLKLQQRIQTSQIIHIDAPKAIKAAVLIAITNETNPRLILTQRAAHLTLHACEVALPGGKQDKSDCNLIETALREAEEEIGLQAKKVQIVGEIDSLISRFNYVITPVVGFIDKSSTLKKNESELSDIFSVPLQWFIETSKKTHINKQGHSFLAYDYYKFKIWGITSMIIVRMLNRYFDANIKYVS